MKKTICNIRTLAALLVAGAAFTACSNEDNYVEEAPQYYTMTVKATKDANTTRALSLADPSGPLTSALNASWEDGDVVTVTNSSNEVVGTLTASEASGLTATFSGPIATTVQKDDVLTLTYHPFNGLSAFSAQDGTLASASNLDVATATVTVTDVTGGVITISGTANFTTQTAVVQLILKDTSNNPINATSLNISVMSMNIFTFSPSSTAYTNNGDGILYFALPSQATVATMKGVSSTVLNMATITFTASDGTNTYAASKTGYTFAAGTYYGATLSMTKQAPPTLASESFTTNKGITTYNGTHFTITCTNAGDEDGIQIGRNNTLTITAKGSETITKVEFHCEAGVYYVGQTTVTAGTLNWTGSSTTGSIDNVNATTVTMSNSNNGWITINQITVYYYE